MAEKNLESKAPNSPALIPLPSSKGSSLVSTSKKPERLTTDIPLVAINFSGTSPSSNLPPSVLAQAPPPTLINRQSAELEEVVLVGLGFGSDLGIGNGSDIARRRFLDDEDDGGSDLEVMNVSPITYTASGLASPTLENFARATQHLRRDSEVRRESERSVSVKEERRPRATERESCEDVAVVPNPRQNVEMGGIGVSTAEQGRIRRRIERRESAQSTPVTSPETVQKGWEKRG